jgi:transcriptional regulator with XRE-family HTH domain
VDDRRVGRLIRAARVRKGWRQADVETASGVDQTTVSLIEAGRIGGFTVNTVRLVADAVGVPIELWPRMSAADATRLLDEGHARLVETVLRLLHDRGSETIAEYTFSRYGERGSVDIVSWHAATRTLLIVEIKTVLLDVQDLLATLDRKCRVVPQLLARERGWRPLVVARLVVVEDRSTARSVVAAHRATFDSALPGRSRAARQWVAAPSGPLAGLWFLSSTNGIHGNHRSGAVGRVRRSRGATPERGSHR